MNASEPMPAAEIRRLMASDAWAERTSCDAARARYLVDAHQHRLDDNPATADIIERAYWAEIDNPEPDR